MASKKEQKTIAIHKKIASKDVVGIGNLRVMITNDDGSWFAQGLEIDYAAEGPSLAIVKKNFEQGLLATINNHLQAYGFINHLIHPAPQSVWIELVNAAKMKKVYSQVSVHGKIQGKFPFQQIEYFEQTTAKENSAI